MPSVKKHALDPEEASSSSGPAKRGNLFLVPRTVKRPETRACPICEDIIPIRLLPKHVQVEKERLEEIIKSIGDLDPILPPEFVEGSSKTPTRQLSRHRRATIKTRKPFVSSSAPFLAQTTKTLNAIKRNRRQRYARLREVIKDEDEGPTAQTLRRRTILGGGQEILCPICNTIVRGDEDVVDAHVDACIADAARKREEERQRATGGDGDDLQMDIGDAIDVILRGTGFHARRQHDADVEDEIDVDGDDEFGDAQFSEGDILALGDIMHLDDDGELRDLVAQSKVANKRQSPPSNECVKAQVDQELSELDQAIQVARENWDPTGLIAALENKLKRLESMRVTSGTIPLVCRICLDPYSEPTVSTGCWHTCCRECWLRSLGSSKLCPICKRITAATDLRRVYL